MNSYPSAFPLGKPFGLQKKREGFRMDGAPNPFDHFEAADDFVLPDVGKGIGEEEVEAFVDLCRADDPRSSDHSAKRQRQALRCVEKEDRIEFVRIERLSESEKFWQEGLFGQVEFVDMGIVL